MNDLQRFVTAQEEVYAKALTEISNGRKQTHWMWFIFPQLAGLGQSSTSQYYAIKDINEAEQYLSHLLLGKRLIEISMKLLEIDNKTAYELFGKPDDMKLRSCMTLFSSVPSAAPVFKMVLEKYFDAVADERTMKLLRRLL